MKSYLTNYINRGWQVFPCVGKIPLTKNGHKDASLDASIFDKHPGSNIGIATSNLLVVDVDCKNGAIGYESLVEIV